MQVTQIRFKKLRSDAIIPSKAGDLEAGMDIATVDYYQLGPGESHIFHTGLASSIDAGYCVVLFDRSGMGAKKNIHRLAGVIDSTYRGEWLVCLVNLSENTYLIQPGDNIVQGLILPVPQLSIIEVDSLDDTTRGTKGFGSTDSPVVPRSTPKSPVFRPVFLFIPFQKEFAMKWIVCVLFLAATLSADTAFARGGRGFFRGRSSGGGSTSASQNAPIDEAPVYPVEHQLLKAINAVRERYGLKALIMDVQLHRSTRQHCGWMANTRQMIHSAGHAENIAMGQPDVDAVMNAWMNSSGHRANILNPGYTKVGLSGYASPSGSPFWCQQFE